MTTVDSFKQSMINFNNQWLLVETTTTKQKLPMPTKITSANTSPTTNLEISSSINCNSPDRMEILHNVILNGWIIQTISIFKPSTPPISNQSSLTSSSTTSKQSNLSIPQESKIQNTHQPTLTESPKSTAFGSCGEEEIEEEEDEDSIDNDDAIIDEENQYDPEGEDEEEEDDDDDDEQKNNEFIEQESIASIPQQNIEEKIQNHQGSSDDQLLLEILNKFPLSINTNQNLNNQNSLIKSPKKNNSNINNYSSAFSRSTANSSASSSTMSKSNKNGNMNNVPAFSCDNIIEDMDRKKRVKKTSILTDDSVNETRQNFEIEDNIQSQQQPIGKQNGSAGVKESKRSSRNSYYQSNNSRSVNPILRDIDEVEPNNSELQISLQPSATKSPSSPLRNVSSSITAMMMQMNNINESNNDILQNSSCSQNEDSSNFSSETDKIYNSIIRRKRQILKKTIAKSSTNIDKPLGSNNQQSKISKYPRKSSYLNQIKLASSPSLTSINHKRDRKNLVKNFIKAFRGFINNSSDEAEVLSILIKVSLSSDPVQVLIELNEIRKNFEKFITKKNYNNTLMVELIQNIEFNTLFNHFLQEKAQDWIQSSKIKDKLSHEEALNHYLLSIKDTKALAKVRCLKYRSANNIEESSISPINNNINKTCCDQFVTFQ